MSSSQTTGPTPAAAHPQKGKGTFTDDLHQLVDNWARDAINLSHCKRGPKSGAQAALGHDVGIQYSWNVKINLAVGVFCGFI